MEGLCKQLRKIYCLQKTVSCINYRCAAELMQSYEWEWTMQKSIFIAPPAPSPAPTQLCLNYTVLTLTVFLYSGSSCYLHPQPGSATLLLIIFTWVLKDTQASLGFSSLKSKSSSYFGAMPAALLWPPVQMEIIQFIQKEAFASMVLPFCDDGHLSAEGRVITWTVGQNVIKLTQEYLIF